MHLLVHGRALPAAERKWEKGSFPFGWQVYFDGRACLDEKRAAKRQPSLDWLIANRDMLPKLQKAKEREGDGACGMKRGRAKTQPSATSKGNRHMSPTAEAEEKRNSAVCSLRKPSMAVEEGKGRRAVHLPVHGRALPAAGESESGKSWFPKT